MWLPGNFTRDPDIEGEDEIGTVGKIVNDMSERIDTLMAERLEHEKEKGDLELKMLQAQINPHFLYNTLDSIGGLPSYRRTAGLSRWLRPCPACLRIWPRDLMKR